MALCSEPRLAGYATVNEHPVQTYCGWEVALGSHKCNSVICKRGLLAEKGVWMKVKTQVRM